MSDPSGVAASARASIVSIESAVGSGSGYCALANGIIVTSQRVVGYEREVLITTDQGTAARALVLRVNVALDVALCAPEESLGLPPITLGGAPPNLADPVLILGRVGADALALWTTVSATERTFDGMGYIQTQAIPDGELCGAALLDASGKLVGSLVRPRRRRDGAWARNLFLPLAAFEGGLMSVDAPIDGLRKIVPEYGCPRCDTVFEPGLDRCLECGIVLPHPWFDGPASAEAASSSSSRVGSTVERRAHRAASVALRALGIDANRARVGALLWRFVRPDGAPIDLTVDDKAESLVLRSEVSRMPDAGFEHFYRHLLTENATMGGPFRLGIRDMSVVMTAFEPVASLSSDALTRRVDEFVAEVTRCQASFKRLFAAAPSI